MKAYIISVAMTAIAAMFAINTAPSGKNGGFSPYIRLISSFVLISVIISPLSSMLSCDPENSAESFIGSIGLPDRDFYESDMINSLSKLNASQLEATLKAMICEEYGIDSDNIKVEVQYTVAIDRTEYSRVLVLLSGKAIFKDPKVIEAYVTNLCDIPCDCALG